MNEKAKQLRALAEDRQPKRCVKCNEPVSMAKHHCACTRSIDPNWGKAVPCS